MQLQQGLYNVVLLSAATCLFTRLSIQVGDEFPVEGMPTHQAIMKMVQGM